MVSLSLGSGGRITTMATLHLLTFFVMAMVCHRALADSRPRVDHLTEFYLWISLGGVLGGVFNVIIAPLLYRTVVEYPFAVVLALGLRPSRARSFGGVRALALDVLLPALIVVTIWAAYRLDKPPTLWGSHGPQLFLIALALVVALFWRRPFRLALGAGALYLGMQLASASASDIVLERRSFFGVYRVRELFQYTILQNGTTTHGGQSRQEAQRREPLTYYYRGGPLGALFESVLTEVPERRVAVVGLGTGTIACYGRPGESWTFFEIDPLVERIATSSGYFTYLRDCPPHVDLVTGDARLSLTRVPDSTFDLIILDAFTSDAIPVHLVTKEALALYFRKLRPGGVVVFHISNRYVDLRPVLIALANDAHVAGALGEGTVEPDDRARLFYPSRWVALARHASTLAALVRRDQWSPLGPTPTTRLWTDDYSDVLAVLRW
jgi:SAM-dependent methyltransferase